MKLKEAVYETCKGCGTRKKCISEEVYGCDTCKKPIDLYSGGTKRHDYLEVKIFREGQQTEDRQFCSWRCVFVGLKSIKSDYFATLPYIHFDNPVSGQGYADLMKCIKTTKRHARNSR